MSLGQPLALIGLAALPPLTTIYAREQRRRAAAAGLLAAAPLLASLTPRRPQRLRLRRHASYTLLCLGVAALIIAAASPRYTARRPGRAATAMVLGDVSAPTTVGAVTRAARGQISVLAAATAPRLAPLPRAPSHHRAVVALGGYFAGAGLLMVALAVVLSLVPIRPSGPPVGGVPS